MILKKTTKKTSWIKIRVTPEEKKLLQQQFEILGFSLTDYIRIRTLDYRVRQSTISKEYILQLARIGANLNQIAKWANIYKSKAETIEILMALASIENELHTLKYKE